MVASIQKLYLTQKDENEINKYLNILSTLNSIQNQNSKKTFSIVEAKNNGITVNSVSEVNNKKSKSQFMINYKNGNYVDKNKWL